MSYILKHILANLFLPIFKNIYLKIHLKTFFVTAWDVFFFVIFGSLKFESYAKYVVLEGHE